MGFQGEMAVIVGPDFGVRLVSIERLGTRLQEEVAVSPQATSKGGR